MNNKISNTDSLQDRWARFRFSVIGPLLSSPPEPGDLKAALEKLSQTSWRHPITGEITAFAFSTIERWFINARNTNNPITALRKKRRSDADNSRKLSSVLRVVLQQQYKNHPSWSYQLHSDNLAAIVKQKPTLGSMPHYSTIFRYMKAAGLIKQPRINNRKTAGALLAAQRLESREVRSFEMEHVHALWHLDFHHGSRLILGCDGTWKKPLLLVVMDDRSRLICHAQWYLDETVETLVHGFMQALQKRGLPRALMSDNGSAMVAAEFVQGLERLSILHQPTLPYSPYQNAKQEVLWAQVEGRLMAMLDGVEELTLAMLNEVTIPWVEQEYHRKIHSEIGATPLNHYLAGPNVGRECPGSNTLREAFCMQVSRKQRLSDGTLSLEGKRFEVPSQYKHLTDLVIRYARWDLSHVWLIDHHANTIVCALYPQDKSANSSGLRRALNQNQDNTTAHKKEPGMAPLLKELIAMHAATGLPPAYIPKIVHEENK